ncbi:MAG: DUF721 domain-containing protein [Candidatus Omnitrophica bacterium]|nr:DUF721 domain-containing protein [Candidatus Omnitrophota bacterium]MCM8788241.1 DUF721 domain-containing protein [Candidatus Omnitrophota bacterium]
MTEKKISEVLAGILKKTDSSETHRRNTEVVDWEKIWAEMCGEARNYSYVIKYADGTLIVAVKNSAWVLELSKREKELLEKLQKTTGEKIKSIKFVR